MVATSIVSQRATESLKQVRRLVEEHGSAEQLARLDDRARIAGGGVPSPMKTPIEFAAYQSEAIAILAEILAELKAANAPRPRGRPRKDAAQQTR